MQRTNSMSAALSCSFTRRSFFGAVSGALCALGGLSGCSTHGDAGVQGENGGSSVDAGDESRSSSGSSTVIETPYFAVVLPSSWEGRYYYSYNPSSYYLDDNAAEALYGPSLSVFLDGSICTFTVAMSKPAAGSNNVAIYEGMMRTSIVGKAGKDDEWDLFVSAAMDADNPDADVPVDEYAQYVSVRYDPSSVTDPGILLGYLTTEEGFTWGHGEGSDTAMSAIRDVLQGYMWVGTDPQGILSSTIERDSLTRLRFAAMNFSDDQISFRVPYDVVSFSNAGAHLNDDDASLRSLSAQYEIRDWGNSSEQDNSLNNLQDATANYALAVELIESVDGGKNWEKSRVVICQELPYGGAPRVALVYDDTNDLRYYEGPQSVLESIEKQDAMRGDAESLLSEYYPIADEAERQDLAHWFGNQPTVEYALRASFENYRFDAASGYLVKLYTDSINSPIGALLPAVLYDYGNGEVYFKLLY